MKITVYKGFDKEFLKNLNTIPLINNDISQKLNVIQYDRKLKKKLSMALLSLEENTDVWITYEEYTLIRNLIMDTIIEDDVELIIFSNNLYPDYYPLDFEISDNLALEIEKNLNSISNEIVSKECQNYLSIYNTLVLVENTYYGSFYNFEYDIEENINSKPYYPYQIKIENDNDKSDFDIFINNDVDSYLRDLVRIKKISPKTISVKMTDTIVSQRIFKSLSAYCLKTNIRLVNSNEQLKENPKIENELIDIAKNEINIKNFQKFRPIRFYKRPDIDKEIIEISQSTIIQEIIKQAEISYDDTKAHAFRDIFITSSTGSGKSIMFQIPAIYIAKHFKKLTIIIEPVKALMQDQKEKLVNNGFTRVEVFNSDLISQTEKEAVLKKIKNGEVDLLYLSPETLLSYSIETIIGDREIGLIIIDEAHIVTTWGMGFRPDYWYLGGYINKLRNKIQTTAGKQRKIYKFPICAFTATAINGGVDDSVSDTVTSLYMENPIKYIGYVRRDDIGFDIKICENKKLPQSIYETKKTEALSKRLNYWLDQKEKTIVYFPYAQNAYDAFNGTRGFYGIKKSPNIGVYTGKNVNKLKTEKFNENKKETFNKFKTGECPIIYATKAFGMGIDIDNVKNVYHYALSGNLSDYIQEIGRAARNPLIKGVAITDFFHNDMTYMNKLFGMSQIKQYQIKKVLDGIYDVYKSKNYSRNFLISPQSFTYIFNGKGMQREDECINKLKTCLLMLEKDFFDKYNFKVIISRPQSVFTKTYVAIDNNHIKQVLNSIYGKCFKFLDKGRCNEKHPNGFLISDIGDIYTLDLKAVWENFYKQFSFPHFKYMYFNDTSIPKNKIDIMPEIRKYFSPRQKINIEAQGDLLLNEIREKILDDFEYIGNTLYREFSKSYFTIDDFTRAIISKYGKTQARIISNSLFDLVDPNMTCVKRRSNEKASKNYYMLSNGNFKEYMRKPIIKSSLVNMITNQNGTSYSSYKNMTIDNWSNIALKLLSVFDYISYEILGGEEPEIFIRLNDPQKIKNIVIGNTYYSNNYVNKARQKHDRDMNVILNFFNNLSTDKERWDYIENYFLGYDVLNKIETIEENITKVAMLKSIDKDQSFSTHHYKNWAELDKFFDENEHIIVDKIAKLGIIIPEYINTTLKKSNWGNNILMSWPSRNTLICQQDTANFVLSSFKKRGWNAYKIYDIDYDKIKELLN